MNQKGLLCSGPVSSLLRPRWLTSPERRSTRRTAQSSNPSLTACRSWIQSGGERRPGSNPLNGRSHTSGLFEVQLAFTFLLDRSTSSSPRSRTPSYTHGRGSRPLSGPHSFARRTSGMSAPIRDRRISGKGPHCEDQYHVCRVRDLGEGAPSSCKRRGGSVLPFARGRVLVC